MAVEPVEQTRTWAEGRARELVATRLAVGGASGEHPCADRWRALLEETLTSAGAARMASLVSELAELGADGVEAREWLPKRPPRPAPTPPAAVTEIVPTPPRQPVPDGSEGPARSRPWRWLTKRSRRTGVGMARTAVVAVVVGLLMKAFVLQVFFVPSSSMAPTLNPGERVAVDKLAFRFDRVTVGDVVVFRAPEGQTLRTLVKRVVAEEGDEVAASGGRLTINDEVADEPYLPEGTETLEFGPVAVPEGHLFVLGDNRMSSFDSRMFGPVPEESVIGRPLLRVWPLGQIGPL